MQALEEMSVRVYICKAERRAEDFRHFTEERERTYGPGRGNT